MLCLTRNNRIRHAGVLLLVGGMALLAAPRVAGQTYVVSELDAEGAGASQVYGINNTGQMVGVIASDTGGSHSAHWLNDVFTDLHGTVHLSLLHPFRLFNNDWSEAYDVSNGGQIVGGAQTTIQCGAEIVTILNAMVLRPAVLTDLATPIPGDALTNLGTLGEPCSAFDSAAVAISNANHVVGWADVDNGGTVHAYLVTPQNGVWFVDGNDDLVNDIMVDLGTLDGQSVVSSASAVNDHGVVVGYSFTRTDSGDAPVPAKQAVFHAFRVVPNDTDADGEGDQWFVDDGNGGNALMTDLRTLGGFNSWARGVNNAGQIVGESGTAEGYTRAFLWENGTMTDLGTLGGANSSAARINDNGDVVGWAETATGQRRAVAWINGEIKDLNSSLLPTANPKVVLTEARDINSNGQIAGWGTQKSGTESVNGAFLLRIATATEIAEAEAAVAAAGGSATPTGEGSVVSGATSDNTGGSTGGTGDFDGIPLDTTPSSDNGDTSDTVDGDAPDTVASPVLCGPGAAAFAPLTILSLGLIRIGRRRVR